MPTNVAERVPFDSRPVKSLRTRLTQLCLDVLLQNVDIVILGVSYYSFECYGERCFDCYIEEIRKQRSENPVARIMYVPLF